MTRARREQVSLGESKRSFRDVLFGLTLAR